VTSLLGAVAFADGNLLIVCALQHMTRTAATRYRVVGRGFPLLLGYPMLDLTAAHDLGSGVIDRYVSGLQDAYRILVTDYPFGVFQFDSAFTPRDFTADRVSADLLALADLAGFERFAWWGYSWGGVVGLQLATSSQRVAALVCGGWPPLGGPYEDTLRAMRVMAANPPLDTGVPYDAFVAYYESLSGWPEAESVAAIICPRLTYFGSNDELEIAGVTLPLASRFREHRSELEQQGWEVTEIPGRDHSIYLHPAETMLLVREFLDRTVSASSNSS
jgi:hypothetical protein